MVAVQLLGFEEPAAQHGRAFLDYDVARKEALVNGAGDLTPQGLGKRRDDVRSVFEQHVLIAPCCAVSGVTSEEEQPRDRELRRDMDLDVADSCRANLPG